MSPTGRRRFREGSDYRSFPMYAGAAAVGWSRMFDNKHWASDVIILLRAHFAW